MRPRNLERRRAALRMKLDGASYAAIGAAFGVSAPSIQEMLRPPAAVYNLVRERAGGCCEDCGIGLTRSGHVHHRSGLDEQGWDNAAELQFLCASCHRRAHVKAESICAECGHVHWRVATEQNRVRTQAE